MNIKQMLVKQKLQGISVDELLKYCKQYNVQITKPQAEKVLSYAKSKNINVFNDEERKTALKDLAKLTSPEVARQVNALFLQFIK